MVGSERHTRWPTAKEAPLLAEIHIEMQINIHPGACKTRRKWNLWKMFEKMTKERNFYLFWGPKRPGNWASGANIQHISKSNSNWHLNQDWCKTTGKCLRKWPKTGIFFYLFGVQSGPKIEPLRPILSTHLKVLAMRTWSNTDVKRVEKMTKDLT